jgi:hypothetical protein
VDVGVIPTSWLSDHWLFNLYSIFLTYLNHWSLLCISHSGTLFFIVKHIFVFIIWLCLETSFWLEIIFLW